MAEATCKHLKWKLDQGILVLTITETYIHDDGVVEGIRTEMLRVVSEAGCRKVVVDLQHTTQLSSLAFRPLLTLRKHLLGGGGKLILCGLSPAIAEIFTVAKLTGKAGELTPIFEVEGDLPAALARLG